MINDVKEYYTHLAPTEKAIVRGVGYAASSALFACVTYISGRIAVTEDQPALYVFETVGLIATVETAKKAWKSFKEAFGRV